MDEIYTYLSEATGFTADTQIKLFLTILIIVVLIIFRVAVSRVLMSKVSDYKTRYIWQRTISFIFSIIAISVIATIWTSALKEFGAFLALIAAGLAIALKDPLTNFAGWLFIIFRKPFNLGDRVQVGNFTGDVIDIRLFQFTILEIGNWVEADQSTGRIIHIPNGKVFLEAQANYSSGFEYIWHEIPVIVTFESNWKKAKEILTEIIENFSENTEHKVQRELHEASKNYLIYYEHLTPIVYTKVKDNGVQLTIRFLCNPRSRRSTENDIWEKILSSFNDIADIDFAYPTTRFYEIEKQEL